MPEQLLGDRLGLPGQAFDILRQALDLLAGAILLVRMRAFQQGQALHVRLGREAGLDDRTIERVAAGPEAEGWDDRRAALLTAVDELHRDGAISPQVWERLRRTWTTSA